MILEDAGRFLAGRLTTLEAGGGILLGWFLALQLIDRRISFVSLGHR